MSPRHSSFREDAVAFSLVEVVLALAVFAFAFVGLLGLIPAGLSSLDTAIDSTVESQIIQHVATLARQSSFNALRTDALNVNPGLDDKYTGREKADYFFNEQGEEIKDPMRQKLDYAYSAAVSSQVGATVPDAASGFVNMQVATVRVSIVRRSAPEKLRSFTLLVANNGLGP